MIREFLAVGAVAAIVGCSAEIKRVGGGDKQAAKQAEIDQRTQLAAFAAREENQYPSTRPTDDVRASAVVDAESGALKIYNFSDEPLTDVKVWVNGQYLHRVDRIPAGASVTLDRSQFYDREGMNLAQRTTPINQVQIQSGDRLQNLQGPLFE